MIFRWFIYTFLLIMAMGITTKNVHAQGSTAPLEITADDTLEWNRSAKTFTAYKNAKAQQGDLTVESATLTAYYREGQSSDTEIWQITADDDVMISNFGSRAYGDKAIYDIDSAKATMTGKNLRMISDGQTVTARDRFEYWSSNGRLVAVGNAVAIRGEDRLQANQLESLFANDANGKRTLDKIIATGNVIITTPTETLTGTSGVYRASTNIAEITGNVRITRGPNILTGSKAQIDLNTNISRMFGGQGGRVSGTFFPKSDKQEQ